MKLDFWRVAIKPGKPLAFGRGARAAVLGLPGNPASAIVTFVLFGMPLLRAMQRDARPLPLLLRARLAAARKRSPDRLELVRAALQLDGGTLVARVHDNQSSGAATSLASPTASRSSPPATARSRRRLRRLPALERRVSEGDADAAGGLLRRRSGDADGGQAKGLLRAPAE